MLRVDVPGLGPIELDSLVLDLNGTITEQGHLIDGVVDRMMEIAPLVRIYIVSADTRGSAEAVLTGLPVQLVRVSTGLEKLGFVRTLGASKVVMIGNGANDARALKEAALGIAVIGREGASSEAVLSSDLICSNVLDALDLILAPQSLRATLRP